MTATRKSAKKRPPWLQHLWRMLLLLLLCTLSLQLFWLLRIGMMRVVDPQSTSFQRSEAWRLLVQTQRLSWRQEWVDMPQIGDSLQRAVIASEDAGFVEHSGVEWDAIENAWERNRIAEARADRRAAQLERQQQREMKRQQQREQARRQSGTQGPSVGKASTAARPAAARLVGGSTISQQLAKNLFLSGERTPLRKAQELVITLALEATLPKERILEIYLNNVEWGEGLFGAQAAAQHYFRSDAAKLAPWQAARLAVMLPAPKRFEKNPGSAYLQGRTATLAARMGDVVLP